MSHAHAAPSNIGIIAAGGPMPFAVADSLIANGQMPVIFGLRGLCAPEDAARYRHHWISVGQFGRLFRLLRDEHCNDVVFIGAIVRPALSEIRLDLATLRAMPQVFKAFRGGDDHLLSKASVIFERQGFRLRGAHEVAPNLLMPEGCMTKRMPDANAQADIAKGLSLLTALSPFDIGQAVVVIDGHVIGVEGIEGTDALLARVAQLRADGRLRKAPGRGVVVKAPKQDQDLRFDLPTVGPRTVAGTADARLGGLAVMAQRTLAAEPMAMTALADRHTLFVVGVAPS